MDRITARRTTRCLLALTLAALAHGTAGCGDRVIDGSTTFNQQHPEYQDKPAYMDPASADDTTLHNGRPW